MMKNLSKLIKRIRKEKGMTQQEISKKLNISRQTYISIEQGVKEISLSELQTITDVFGLNLDDLKMGLVPDYEKYKEMILSFLRSINSKGDGKVPKTKLAKLLYLADFAWFYNKMESMSGMRYRRVKYGPVPDMYYRALNELEEEGVISIDNKKNDVILISENDWSKRNALEKINKEESALIKSIAKKWDKKTTREIVSFAHNQLPYKLCSADEFIPYELIIQEDPSYIY